MVHNEPHKKGINGKKKSRNKSLLRIPTYFIAEVTWGWLKAIEIGLIITRQCAHSSADKQTTEAGGKVDKVLQNAMKKEQKKKITKKRENGIEAFLMLLCPPDPTSRRNKGIETHQKRSFIATFHLFILPSSTLLIHMMWGRRIMRYSPIIITNFFSLCFLCPE